MYTTKGLDEERKEGWFIEDGSELSCPICGSKRISRMNTYQVWTEENMASGKIISKHSSLNPFSRVFHNYICRKCSWQSITFDE